MKYIPFLSDYSHDGLKARLDLEDRIGLVLFVIGSLAVAGLLMDCVFFWIAS